MGHRVVAIALIAVLMVLHGQLWMGRGSLPHVTEMSAQLQAQQELNQRALLVNQQLAAEVRDLKEGLEMVEEKARLELGMVKPNEIFVQLAK
jgi:cell division protein FtsB